MGWQVFRVGRGGPVNGGGLGKADRRLPALLQPGDELGFTRLTQIGSGDEGDHRKHDGQPQEGKAVVDDLEKTLGNIVSNI